jgi:hypothetical protein
MKVSTRNGYAKKGSGDEVGNTSSPQNILAAVVAKRTEPIMPTTRTQTANTLGTLVSRRAVHHKAVPAPNEGTLPSRFVAVPISITLDAQANTRNPAATMLFPFRKNCSASRAVATIKPTPSIAMKRLGDYVWRQMSPPFRRLPPRTRPITATIFTEMFIWAVIIHHSPHATLKGSKPPCTHPHLRPSVPAVPGMGISHE